jgi:hypothetical protein
MSPEKYLKKLCDLEPGVDVVPTDDPAYWVMTKECDSNCYHPVHAFNKGIRRKHLIEVPPFK